MTIFILSQVMLDQTFCLSSLTNPLSRNHELRHKWCKQHKTKQLPVKCRIADPLPRLRRNRLPEPVLNLGKGDIEILCQQPTLIHLTLKDPVPFDHHELRLATVVGEDPGDLTRGVELC